MELILASTSPRRADLLSAAGIAFRADAPEVDESPLPLESPEAYVRRLALTKVRAVGCRNPGSIVLAADTTVVVDDRMLGKPETDEEAARMLEMLSGRTHRVLTGVAVSDGAREASEIASTRVHFLPLTPTEVMWYVRSGEPFGKAGGYAIQGLASRFIDRIEGSYTNVVGLPVSLAHRLLVSLGWRSQAASEQLESR